MGMFVEATCNSNGSLWVESLPNENGMSVTIQRSCVIRGELRVPNPSGRKSVVDYDRTDQSLLGVIRFRFTAILYQ